MDVLYTKFTTERAPRYHISTTIFRNEGVLYCKKIALNKQARAHIVRLKANTDPMLEVTSTDEESVTFEYIQGKTMHNLLYDAAQNQDRSRFFEILEQYKNYVYGNTIVNYKIFKPSQEFVDTFGYLAIHLMDCDCFVKSNIDLSFGNIIKKGDLHWVTLDSEWVFDFEIPVKFSIYRAIVNSSAHYSSLIPGLTQQDMLDFFEISTTECYVFSLFEKHFIEMVVGKNTSHILGQYEKQCNVIALEYAAPELSYNERNNNTISGFATLYFDTGNGFNEDNKSTHGFIGNNLNIEISIHPNTKAVRFDPMENFGCVIENLKVFTNNGISDYFVLNGKTINEYCYFLCNDPQFLINISSNDNKLIIYAQVYHYKDYGILGLLSAVSDYEEDLKKQIKELDELNSIQQEKIQESLDSDSMASLDYATLYLDSGKGFSEENKITHSYYGDDFFIEVLIQPNTKTVRFDPFEGFGCVVDHLKIFTNMGFAEYINLNGYTVDEFHYFVVDDPQFLIYIPHNSVKLIIQAKIIRFDNYGYLRLISGVCRKEDEQNKKIKSLETEQQRKIEELVEKSSVANAEIERLDIKLQNEMGASEERSAIAKAEIERLEIELQREIGASEEKSAIAKAEIERLEVELQREMGASEEKSAIAKAEIERLEIELQREMVASEEKSAVAKLEIERLQESLKKEVYEVNKHIVALMSKITCLENELLHETKMMVEQDVFYESEISKREESIKKQQQYIESIRNEFEQTKHASTSQISELESHLNEVLSQAEKHRTDYDNVLASKAWKLTKPYRLFGDGIKKAIQAIPLNLARKFMKSLAKDGIKATFRKTSAYVHNRNEAIPYLHSSPYDDYRQFTPYDGEYQDNRDYNAHNSTIKALAFYLPQFHQVPENDKWWGEGFTEWTNTKKAVPMYEDHYQPRTPHKDFGFYDLSSISTMKKQAALAKQHGIYGFCFYYYWFSGKRLLEKPVNILLENPSIDINFCLCWANENWTRKWDGLNHDILMKQDYSDKDPAQFILDIAPYLRDSSGL